MFNPIKLPELPKEKNDSPTYRTIVIVNYLSSFYEVHKGLGDFIWMIPSKYKEVKDIEISAITSCFIYDGTKQSVSAAKEIDSWFKGEPFKYIIDKQYNNIVMVGNQNVNIYNTITIKDLFIFFDKLNALYSEYDGIIGKFRYIGGLKSDKTFDYFKLVLEEFRGFGGKSVLPYARIHLFLFMMVHCAEAYPLDQSRLLAPVFPRQMATCRRLRLTKNNRLTTKTNIGVTEKLKWFSKKFPMTFWVGVVAYSDITDRKLLKKLSAMENKPRHIIKK